jgi:hypothetical protein
MLKKAGPYQIEATFVPSNVDYTGSTSVPKTLTMTPPTLNAPTLTILQVTTNSVETGETVALVANVQNADSSLANGTVRFMTVSPRPVVLGEVAVNVFNQQAGFVTDQLQRVGTYEIQAVYRPNTNRFAESTSAPVTVTVTPLTAVALRVTPLVRHGHLNEPMSFEVTALNAQGQTLTDYTGTVTVTSPTDSVTIEPRGLLNTLNNEARGEGNDSFLPLLPQTTGLASIPAPQYTFKPADQGTHTFIGGIAFGKAGAEVLEVTQTNDPKVFGKTTYAIG